MRYSVLIALVHSDLGFNKFLLKVEIDASLSVDAILSLLVLVILSLLVLVHVNCHIIAV